MKTIKQIFNDMLSWWEETLSNKNSRKILFWIIFFVIGVTLYLLLLIPSSAAEEPVEPTEAAVPSDLTGYTVTVPAGWTATAGYGKFSVDYMIDTYSDGGAKWLAIGYSWTDIRDEFPAANSLFTWVTIGQDSGSLFESSNETSFSFTFLGGTDIDNPLLIQWFVDNNATFTPSEFEFLTIPAGIYYMQNIYNDLRGTITFDRPFISGDSLYYNSIEFEGYQDNQYTEVIYSFTPPVSDGATGPPAPPFELSVYNGVDGFENIANCIILIQLDENLTIEEAALFNQAFIPVNSDNKLINLYNGALENGKNFGYNTGYVSGYEEGFTDGVNNSGGNFFGNFIEGILNALDKFVVLPGDISILDIIKTVGGLFVVIWLLKLLAGG